MPTESNGVLRYDINDPADLAALVKTGLIWRGGPQAVEKAVEYLRANPADINKFVPQEVIQTLTADAVPDKESAAEDTAEPVEEPSVTPAEPPVA